jgi:hypothetical protein
MKVAIHIFVLMIGGAALMPDTCRASQQTFPADTTKTASVHRQDTQRSIPNDGGNRLNTGKASGPKQISHKTSRKNSLSGSVARTTSRPKQLSSDDERLAPEKNANLRRRKSITSRGATNGRPNQQETLRRAAPVRPEKTFLPTMPAVNNTRRRSTNPAAIGGPAKSAGEISGAISGTSVRRKP